MRVATLFDLELPFKGHDASAIAELCASTSRASLTPTDCVDRLVRLCSASENQSYTHRPFRENLRNLVLKKRRGKIAPADLVDSRDRNVLVAAVEKKNAAAVREIFWLGLWSHLNDYRMPSTWPTLAGKNALEIARKVGGSASLVHVVTTLTEQENSLSEFARAARAGDLKTLKALVPATPAGRQHLRQWKDARGNGVLHHACAGRSTATALRFLIDLDIFQLNATNEDGDNPLHMAVMYGSPAILRELLVRVDSGLDVYGENARQMTPVLLCAETGHKQMFKIFDQAAAYGRRSGANDFSGGTLDQNLMTVAAGAGQLKFLELCLRRFGLPLLRYHRDRDGSTVLHRACDQHRHAVVAFLLREFACEDNLAAEMLLSRDRFQRTVLHRCCLSGAQRSLTKPNLLNVLLEAAERAGVLDQLIDAKDFYTGKLTCGPVTGRDKGRPAYHYVEVDRHAVASFAAKIGTGSVDVSKYGRVIKSRFGTYPSEAEERQVDSQLYETANLKTHPIRDVTALHIAVFRQAAYEVQVLLNYGADVNVQDRFGLMPLHYAAMRGHRYIMQLLIDAGADVTMTDTSHNKTALEIAELNGHEKIVAWLRAAELGVSIEP